jgi:ribosome-binding protein aMBF1 (putative translation factor)
MTIAKYFWDLKEQALEETRRILKNPEHPKFSQRMATLLSRCDKPKELFSVVPRKRFVETWPQVRTYWVKRVRRADSRDWWETIYEEILQEHQQQQKKPKGGSSSFFREFGRVIKEVRIRRGLSQKQVALTARMKQPDISRIEEGRKNITLFTLIRLCKILGIKKLNIS